MVYNIILWIYHAVKSDDLLGHFYTDHECESRTYKRTDRLKCSSIYRDLHWHPAAKQALRRNGRHNTAIAVHKHEIVSPCVVTATRLYKHLENQSICFTVEHHSIQIRYQHLHRRLLVVTSYRRAAATICPRPSLPLVGAEAQPSRQQRTCSSSFTRPTRSHAHRCSRAKRPGDLDLWPFDHESGVRVTCDVG